MPAAAARADEITPARRPYRPVGSALKLLLDRSPEVLLSGPAGTGKSRGCLEKLHLLAEKYPGLRALIVRRTRASLTQSALVTFEEHVVPAGHPCLAGPARLNRSSYRYPNGSEVALGGLDNPIKVMSSEWDVVYVQEATEVDEAAWEALTIRLRNATCEIPFRQLIADCNPDRPTHWLKKRCDAGRCKMIECRHEDNPRYWDAAAGAWTAAGLDYVGRLDALSGPRKLRLRYGRWVRAEGVVYEAWDPAVHVIDRFAVPADWPRVWVVDFGYRNPFVWQEWALDGDGRLYLVRQVYRTGRIVQDHAERILELTAGSPRPLAVLCDHDAEDRATLERHLGLPTTPAPKAVRPGIEAVQARLRVQGDGRPRLFVLRDSLDEIDPALEEAKKPWRTEDEFDGYCWNDRAAKDEPVKEDDHGLDATRYLCLALDGAPAREEGPSVLRA